MRNAINTPSARYTHTMARPGMRAFSTSGTKRASACGSGSPMSNPAIVRNGQRPDRKHDKHDLPPARLFGIEPLPSSDQQHDDGHDAEPAHRFDAIEAELFVNALTAPPYNG